MKRTIVIALDAALAAFLVAGCATKSPPAPQIHPELEVRHSGIQADGYYQLGRFLQEQQRYDEAVVAYRKALAIDSKHADSHNGLGTIHALRGQYAEAHSEFGAALSQSPDNPSVLNNIGYTFLLERKPVEALAPLTKATELAPENPRYSSNLIVALNNQSPAPAAGLAAAAPATFDAVPAPQRSAESFVSRNTDEAGAARLVSIGPNAFELVIPKAHLSSTAIAALPTSHAGRLGVEVSNGNGTTGMARQVSRQLTAVGVPVKRLTNNLPYGQTSTHVEYRPGHEAAALDLSWRVPGRPPVVAALGLRAGIDVRLVLGKELPVNVALNAPTEQVAYYAVSIPH